MELSVDEALANGKKVAGKDVLFNQPVIFYVENFLHFPVGGVVPVGYYDNDRGVWMPWNNGRILQILNITNGLADVDTDGDGAADSAAALNALGITNAERQQLAELYPSGQSLWRVSLMHFSTWDCNWPYGYPSDAIKPNGDNSQSSVNLKMIRAKQKVRLLGVRIKPWVKRWMSWHVVSFALPK